MRKPKPDAAERCPDCGHERKWHKMNGRDKDGSYRVMCIAGVAYGYEAVEFCECNSKRRAR